MYYSYNGLINLQGYNQVGGIINESYLHRVSLVICDKCTENLYKGI